MINKDLVEFKNGVPVVAFSIKHIFGLGYRYWSGNEPLIEGFNTVDPSLKEGDKGFLILEEYYPNPQTISKEYDMDDIIYELKLTKNGYPEGWKEETIQPSSQEQEIIGICQCKQKTIVQCMERCTNSSSQEQTWNGIKKQYANYLKECKKVCSHKVNGSCHLPNIHCKYPLCEQAIKAKDFEQWLEETHNPPTKK